MSRHANDARLASAFATLVCAWALALVVLGLAGAPRAANAIGTGAIAAATASR